MIIGKENDHVDFYNSTMKKAYEEKKVKVNIIGKSLENIDNPCIKNVV